MKINIKNNTVSLILGFLAGAVLLFTITRVPAIADKLPLLGKPTVSDLRETNTKYKFIQPLLNTEYSDQDESLRWYPAEKEMQKKITEEINKNSDIKVGFYYHDLTNLSWFGVNSSEKFVPASLLKLPMLISYYKLKETNPTLFDEKITYSGTDYNGQRTVKAEDGIVSGNTYTVRELLNEMIINSDNNALELLYQYKQDSLKSIFDDLQTPLPDTRSEIANSDFVSARDMSKFLLVLYNSSYLTRDSSEEALNLLSKVSFKDGIVAGVPNDIVISHKFGEREMTQPDKSTINEFHDCGIVYVPNHAYEICIMTKGDDSLKQQALIRSLSKITFDEVSSIVVGYGKKK